MRFLNSVKSLYVAVVILILANGVGAYIDFKNEAMHAEHQELSASLERMVRLDQALSGMLNIAILKTNALGTASYDTVKADLEQTMGRVRDMTRTKQSAQEFATLGDSQKAIRELEDQVRQLIVDEKWEEASALLFGSKYLMSTKLYEVDSEAAVGTLTAELAESALQFDRARQVAQWSRIVAMVMLVWVGLVFTRKIRADLDEQKRLAKDLLASQDKLENLIHTGLDLGRERDRMVLLTTLLFGGKTLLNCDAGTLYMLTDHKTLRFALRTKSDELPSFEIPLYDAEGKPVERFMATWCAVHNQPIIVDDVYSETRFDVSGAKKMDAESGYRTVSMLTVPLSPREGEVIGVLQFLNALDPLTGAVIPFSPELVRFVTAMAAQAAVALDNHQLIEAQKQLMDALIKLIAGAVDAKSPYTGGHCERVPELGIMLAEAANAQTEGPLADFAFKTEDEWREFRIGAWLHDCGKVTTPEYVVDKACKLETIYNRIHEVRMRFEALWRDARISQLEALAQGVDAAQAQAAFDARVAQLQDDFAFVAECNQGGEFMAPDKVERLKRIAEQTWLRHFDDRAGLAHEELKRYTDAPAALPATEHLLSDKVQHIIPRTSTAVLDPKWNFKVKVPEHLYNYGEVYNLSVSRGTLTEEERFKINEHVMQSLMMLEQLPLPKNMRRVPEYAGTHHETLVGSGYPRKLTEAELSVPMRIMAIADVFEALTASDRPYKKAKTLSESIKILSESIKILSFFKKDKHIDPALFDLFLTSGVYKRYAEKYLLPEQIDEVDVSQYVSG